MPREVVGKIPEFTENEPLDTGVITEKETPSEAPTEEKPAEEVPEEPETPEEEVEAEEEVPSEDAGKEEVAKQVQGLQAERDKLLKEITGLRGERRELKTKEVEKVEEKLDELKDLHPKDVALIERILKARGYVPKGEMGKMLYDQVKQDELNKFLDKYPEFKPENDPSDTNWNALQEELKYYRMPENPRLVNSVLEKARKAISTTVPSSEQETAVQKAKVATAAKGSGGGQRSSPLRSFPSNKVEAMRRGGWSDEEISEILENLPK